MSFLHITFLFPKHCISGVSETIFQCLKIMKRQFSLVFIFYQNLLLLYFIKVTKHSGSYDIINIYICISIYIYIYLYIYLSIYLSTYLSIYLKKQKTLKIAKIFYSSSSISLLLCFYTSFHCYFLNTVDQDFVSI